MKMPKRKAKPTTKDDIEEITQGLTDLERLQLIRDGFIKARKQNRRKP
jgi:vacuolar-type H+-ATPase subunit D/Vma8